MIECCVCLLPSGPFQDTDCHLSRQGSQTFGHSQDMGFHVEGCWQKIYYHFSGVGMFQTVLANSPDSAKKAPSAVEVSWADGLGKRPGVPIGRVQLTPKAGEKNDIGRQQSGLVAFDSRQRHSHIGLQHLFSQQRHILDHLGIARLQRHF